MKNVFLLATDEPSRLFIIDGKLYNYHKPQQGDGVNEINQNICITSDEKPKEGDWYLYKDKENYEHVFKWAVGCEDNTSQYGKKIILTDNNDLVSDGVQEISEDFLQWFVKNPSCEFVEVVTEQYTQNYHKDIWYDRYKIITPKEIAKSKSND
jgi:hypothetical protein